MHLLLRLRFLDGWGIWESNQPDGLEAFLLFIVNLSLLYVFYFTAFLSFYLILILSHFSFHFICFYLLFKILDLHRHLLYLVRRGFFVFLITVSFFCLLRFKIDRFIALRDLTNLFISLFSFLRSHSFLICCVCLLFSFRFPF